jgi:hypothetical protein
MFGLSLLLLAAALPHAGARAQEPPRPPAAAPQVEPRPRPADSAHGDSIIRARRSVAGLPTEPSRSPLFGEPPFYGYNWVFWADLVAGALTGLLAVRWRSRNDPAGTRIVWMVVGVLLGAAGAAAVFLPLYLLNAMFSIGFSAMPPALMFGLTFGVIAVGALSMAFSRRRG